MDPLYDVCFAGEILQGQDQDTVKLKFAKLFNADGATLEKLFGGKTQLLKRGCDKATALKYKKAIEQAGAKPVIRLCAESPTSESPKSAPQPAPAAPKLSAAERIALVAGAPDVSAATETPQAVENTTVQTATDDGSASFDLATAGADVLRPEERPTATTSTIDTSDLELMSVGVDLSDVVKATATAPDVTHLSMGEVGEDIPTLAQAQEIVSPDISAISLSPDDSDFTDCAPPPATEPKLDLSAIVLAPSGADLLEERYRKKTDQVPPKTDHLSLED